MKVGGGALKRRLEVIMMARIWSCCMSCRDLGCTVSESVETKNDGSNQLTKVYLESGR